MRTTNIKLLAEQQEELYDEALEQHLKSGGSEDGFPDIYTWVVMEKMTAEEDYLEYRRDEGLE